MKKFEKTNMSAKGKVNEIVGTALVDNFQPGDLLYGTDKGRKKYIEQLEKENKINDKIYYQADQYNSLGLVQYLMDINEQRGREENKINDRRCLNFAKNNSLGVASVVQPEIKKSPEEEPLKKYEKVLDNYKNRINSGLKSEAEKKALIKHVEYLLTHKKYTPLNFNYKPEKKRDLELQQILRACKAKIIDPSIRHVHFFLDGLDLSQALNKDSNAKDLRYTYYSIVSAEIRMVFKYWKIEKLQDKITFYKNGYVVDAPWITNSELWDKYKKSKEHIDLYCYETMEDLDLYCYETMEDLILFEHSLFEKYNQGREEAQERKTLIEMKENPRVKAKKILFPDDTTKRKVGTLLVEGSSFPEEKHALEDPLSFQDENPKKIYSNQDNALFLHFTSLPENLAVNGSQASEVPRGSKGVGEKVTAKKSM